MPGYAELRDILNSSRARVLLMAVLIGGCRFDEKTVGPGSQQLVVHAVLDPGRFHQRILLERLLGGTTETANRVPFDSLDPIRSRGGAPVTGALVVVYAQSGDSAVARERLAANDGEGTGMYEFLNRLDAQTDPASSPSVPVVRAGTYLLKVTTKDGRVLSASTTVPDAPGVRSSTSLEPFNRDRGDLFLFWDEVPGAERYEILVSSPRGAYSAFVDSLEFELSGELQNTEFQTGDIFVPGFIQQVVAAAVDRNYFDYYRSRNDDVTGRGLLSHINGGLGVFGSMIPLRSMRLAVTADIDHPLEGSYVLVSGAGPPVLQLFVTTSSTNEASLSGNYSVAGEATRGLLGIMRGAFVSIALLRGQSARDTAMVIDGTLDALELRGSIRGGTGSVVYRRNSAF